MNHIADFIFIFGAKYLYLFVVIVAFAWFLCQPRPKQKEFIIFICICLPLIFVLSEIAGRLYYSPRPFVLGQFEPLIYHKPDNGFPSHHTLLVSTISAVIFIFNKRIGLLLWGVSFFVGISRVYTGVHHAVDIAAGVLIPVISVASIFFLYTKVYLSKYKK